jgi:eukaryotic-like serine/threonine-protein kinase
MPPVYFPARAPFGKVALLAGARIGMHGSSVVLIALCTSALTATGTTYVLHRYQVFPPLEVERQVPAPQLVGLSEADARANAQALQLALVVEGREASAGATAGTVLRQSIPPGHRVPNNGGIGVVFAATLPNVPKVTELVVTEAREMLLEHGYKVVEGAPMPSHQIPVGIVARQVPEADSALESGGVVTLHVSSGPAQVEVPKLLGMPLRAAEGKLAELGLELKVRWISKAETVTGTVLSQKPNVGEKLTPKSTIEVVVNR